MMYYHFEREKEDTVENMCNDHDPHIYLKHSFSDTCSRWKCTAPGIWFELLRYDTLLS